MITTKPIHLKILKETPKYILYVDESPKYTIKPHCIKCKKCGTVSYNTQHIADEYCDDCKEFYKDMEASQS